MHSKPIPEHFLNVQKLNKWLEKYFIVILTQKKYVKYKSQAKTIF